MVLVIVGPSASARFFSPPHVGSISWRRETPRRPHCRNTAGAWRNAGHADGRRHDREQMAHMQQGCGESGEQFKGDLSNVSKMQANMRSRRLQMRGMQIWLLTRRTSTIEAPREDLWLLEMSVSEQRCSCRNTATKE